MHIKLSEKNHFCFCMRGDQSWVSLVTVIIIFSGYIMLCLYIICMSLLCSGIYYDNEYQEGFPR